MYPFILKIEYWDDYETPWKKAHIYILTYAESMAAAVDEIEDARYVDNIENIKIISAGDEGQLFEIPGHIAKILAAGGGNYHDGLAAVNNQIVSDKLYNDAEIVHNNIKEEEV